MDHLPVIAVQSPMWALSHSWGRPMSPPYVSSRSTSLTSIGMSPKAKAFTIDALLGLHSRKDFPLSLPTSSTSILQEDSHGIDLRDAPGKLKRHRTVFTESQLQRLEKEFQRQQYLVGPQRRHLAKELALSDLQLKVWFQNRRIKWRKNHRHSDDSAACSSSSDSE